MKPDQREAAPDHSNKDRAARLVDASRGDQRDAESADRGLSETPWPTIEGYRIERRLGRGGMGTVFLGTQLDLHREVAIKVLDVQPSRDEDQLIARFSHEAYTTANLDHPSIVPVHAVGRDTMGRLFYTMRRVRGHQLEEILRLSKRDAQGWNRSRAIAVLVRICQTIEFAHKHKVIHRDLKPANIMVGDLGEVYVVDWGLAKTIGQQDARDVRLACETIPIADTVRNEVASTQRATSESPVLINRSDQHASTCDFRFSASTDGVAASGGVLKTMDGTVLGTPAFMPPEQASGDLQSIDQRSDIYSLGTILYQLLTDQPPYVPPDKNSTPVDIVRSILAGPPETVASLTPDAPPELVAICDKAMSRDREQRYQSAIELADELQAYLDNRVVRAYQSGALAEATKWVLRNRGVAFIGLVAVMCGIVGVAAHGWWQAKLNRELMQTQKEVSEALREQEQTSQKLAGANVALENVNQQLSKANVKITESYNAEAAAKESERVAKLKALAQLSQSYANFGENEAAAGRYDRAALWFAKAAELSETSPDLQHVHLMRAMQFGRAALMPVAAWWDKKELAERGWFRWPMTSRFLFDPSDRYLLMKGRFGTAIIDIWNRDAPTWNVAWLHAAAFSPNGENVALSKTKGNVSIHRLSDKAELYALPRQKHRGPIHTLQYSQSGRLLLVGSSPARIWDFEQARFLKVTYAIGNNVADVGFSRDEEQFLTQSRDGLKVFDIVDEDRLCEPIATSRNAKRNKDEDQELAQTNDEIRSRFTLHHKPRRIHKWPDGTDIDWEFLKRFGGHGDRSIHGTDIDASGRHVAVAHGQGIIRLWRRPARPYWFLRTNGWARPVFSPDSSLVAAVGHLYVDDPKSNAAAPKIELLSTQVYDPATGQPIGPEISVGVPILDGCFSPDGSTLALACAVTDRTKATVLLPDGKAGSLQFWDWHAGTRIGEPLPMPSEPQSVAWHPTKDAVAVGCAAGETLKIDVKSREAKTIFEGNIKNIPWRWNPAEWDACGVAFDSSGARLLWWFGGKAQVLNFDTGAIEYSPPHQRWCTGLESRGDAIAVSVIVNAPNVFSLKNKKSRMTVGGGGSLAHLSRDGRYIISSGNTASATVVWDIERREMVCPEFGDGARDANFIGDTPFVITTKGRDPCFVYFWDRYSGRIAAPTLEIPGSTFSGWIRVAEDGRFAAMSCKPYGLMVIDLRSFHEDPWQGIAPSDALMLAEINTGAWIQDGRLTKLTADKNWPERWDNLQSRYPNFYRSEIPCELAIRDHQTRAHEFDIQKMSEAAMFHRDWAAKLLLNQETFEQNAVRSKY